MGERIIAPRAVLKQDGLLVRSEGEDLEHAGRSLALPARIAHRHADGDARAFLDELRRLKADTLPVALPEEVDHLPPIPSDRRLAGGAAAGDSEPLRLLGEQLAKAAQIAGA